MLPTSSAAHCRAAGVASTSGRPSPAKSPAIRRAWGASLPTIRLQVDHACCVATFAKTKEAVEASTQPAESTGRYDTIARAIEARLEKLHQAAPDDVEIADFSEEAMGWDENELLEEGELLALKEMASAPAAVDLDANVAAEDDKKQKRKAVPEEDPNATRKRQGRRLVVTQIPVEKLPKIAIIGRPNVGKSALFNRIIGKAAAIVYDTPGVTRDRLYMRAGWGNREFVLVDTGGLMSSAAKLPTDVRSAAMVEISAANLPSAIERQAAAGIGESDVIVLVCDGQTGPCTSDDEIVSWLRRQHPKKPVVLVVNKCESATQGDIQAAQFWEWGLEPLAISAISGTGTGEMMERILDVLPTGDQQAEKQEREVPLAIAVVGRPNVGKSSLVNAITGTDRAIVSSMSGTTRDAVDTEVILPDGTPINLIDTAGIRKRAKVVSSADGAEPISVVRAIRAVRRTDVVVMMLDAVTGVTVQDFRIAELAAAEGRAVVLVVNKWDLVPSRGQDAMREAEEDIKSQLRPVQFATTVFTSAIQGKNIHKVLDACIRAGEMHNKRVPTATLNMVVNEAVMWKAPPSSRGHFKKPKIMYATQGAVRPPTFVFFCNDGRLIGDGYKRYLERSLRENIALEGTPIRLFFRGKTGTSDRAVAAPTSTYVSNSHGRPEPRERK